MLLMGQVAGTFFSSGLGTVVLHKLQYQL